MAISQPVERQNPANFLRKTPCVKSSVAKTALSPASVRSLQRYSHGEMPKVGPISLMSAHLTLDRRSHMAVLNSYEVTGPGW
jgi:hypothetical protein